MIKLFLGIAGIALLIQVPIMCIITFITTIALYAYKPRSFPSNRADQSSSLRTGDSGTSGDKGFTTTKEQQEKWVKEFIRPDWDPWSPENIERTKAIHATMDRNRKIAQREMADQILREQNEKARSNKVN